MPPLIPHHHHASADLQSQPKPSSKLLSFLLKVIIMTLLTSLSSLFLGFAAFVLLHLCFIGSVLHRLRSRPTIQLGTSSNGIAPHDVTKLPHFRVSKGTEPGSETQCVVCLDGFRNGHWCRKLAGCGHVFHRRCVDTWLVKVAACPTCRTPVRLNAGALSSALAIETEEAKQFSSGKKKKERENQRLETVKQNSKTRNRKPDVTRKKAPRDNLQPGFRAKEPSISRIIANEHESELFTVQGCCRETKQLVYNQSPG